MIARQGLFGSVDRAMSLVAIACPVRCVEGDEMNSFLRMAAIAGMATLLFGGAAQAALVAYSGFDAGAVAVGPQALAAATAFEAATGPTHLADFENVASGTPVNGLAIAPGVTLANGSFGTQITDTSVCSLARCGFNTSAGGANFASLFGGVLTFNFATPIDSFGAYFTGLQLVDVLAFDDGSGQTVAMPLDRPNGGVAFVGFTDFGASITSLTINVSTDRTVGQDIIGIDDVRFRAAGGGGGVPEPATWTMVVMGFGFVAASLRDSRRRRA
jgi:hypothetical protein